MVAHCRLIGWNADGPTVVDSGMAYVMANGAAMAFIDDVEAYAYAVCGGDGSGIGEVVDEADPLDAPDEATEVFALMVGVRRWVG